MYIRPFPPVFPHAALIPAPDAFFAVVKEDYREYRRRGMFCEPAGEALLVYRLRENGRSYTGVIAALPAEQYEDGTIRQHEGTLAASEQQQLQLLMLREAVVKPVLLTYPAREGIRRLLSEAVSTAQRVLFVKDEPAISHEVFALPAGSDLERELRAAFANVPTAYIADGHHRCATVARYNRERRARGQADVPLLAALFSGEEVRVNPYHRVVQLPTTLSPLALVARLSDLCTVEPLPEATAPRRAGELTMILRDEAFRLRWRTPNTTAQLDAGRFNDEVATPIFGVRDIRTDQRVTYVPGAEGLAGVLAHVQHRADLVGFLLHGIDAEDMFGIVDAGGIMPPKSTWFEPRLRNGLTVLEL